MRRNRASAPAASPFRALAHHQVQHGAGHGQGTSDSPGSLIRSFNVESNPTRPMRPSPLTASTIPDMPLEIVDRIRNFPLFMSAPDDFLVALGKHLRPQVNSAHDHILTEGDPARAMYWLVRGVVAVTSRDGEAVYAELKPGAFFGEIGVLMDMPRTATIIARTKCLLVVLKKEDLQTLLPRFPEMENAIRQEAQERLNILKKKQQERGGPRAAAVGAPERTKTSREAAPGEVSTGEVGVIREGEVLNSKKRKSPSPGVIEDAATGGSALGSGFVNVRKTLKELPLFSELPPDILHFLGLSAQPKTYTPFTDIIQQGSPGNEIYFIVRGEAEVIHDTPGSPLLARRVTTSATARPRLKQGQYFGEVASLGLSDGRTATVRSITTVECLMISGEALDELWRRCPPKIRKQVEETARRRYQRAGEDVEMRDADDPASDDEQVPRTPSKQTLPRVIFTTPSKPASPTKDEGEVRHPTDPDPFLSVNMENLRNRRRNSLAPPTPQSETISAPPHVSGLRSQSFDATSLKFAKTPAATPPDTEDRAPAKKPRTVPRRPRGESAAPGRRPSLPDDVFVAIFQQLDILELLRLRQVSSHWRQLLSTSPKICAHVDLSPFNRYVSDWAVTHVLAPFIGARPETIDLSNCFHITDEGFQVLWETCGKNVRSWRMKSVWDVSANQILDMSENAKGLEEADWSNCRKVGDNLLARVVGWVVPDTPPQQHRSVVISGSAAKVRAQKLPPAQQRQHAIAQPQNGGGAGAASPPAPGTVVGCPKLKSLNLSYCKHITDRSMAHLAANAHGRLESLSLTRCTSITDAGFQSWTPYRFTALTRLCLADCTYLSDNAIIPLVSSSRALTHLDLSFCCALSDTATEVVALGLPALRELRLAFCGSAVSDASLGCIGLHLNELTGLSVRGCVRVTGVGVESVLEGCGRLRWLDVSQCKNLAGWLADGGVARWGVEERGYGPCRDAAPGISRERAPVVAEQRSRPPAATAPSPHGDLRGVFGFGSSGVGVGTGGSKATAGARPASKGPMTKPNVPAPGMRRPIIRRPVRFIVEKGAGGLR